MTDRLSKLRDEMGSFAMTEVRRVKKDYREFYKQGAPDDAKGYSAFHSACKTALGHLETLLKLARWSAEETEGRGAEVGAGPDLRQLLQEARAAVTTSPPEDKDE